MDKATTLLSMQGRLTGREIAELDAHYSGPGRYYHTHAHLAEMFQLGRPHGLSECQVMAIWYHDAIYEVPGEDNEARSAELAGRRLPVLGFDAEEVAQVQQIILDTRQHLASIEESKLVLDLDLASLAAEPEVFDHNTRLIRREYAVVPDEEFSVGRVRFFEACLARDRLYQSEAFAHLEPLARANLERVLAGKARG